MSCRFVVNDIFCHLFISVYWVLFPASFFFFFFNDTAPPEISPLPLHAALPICRRGPPAPGPRRRRRQGRGAASPPRLVLIGYRGAECRGQGTVFGPTILRSRRARRGDRKSTRLNSSHGYISYAVFCLKKKKKNN